MESKQIFKIVATTIIRKTNCITVNTSAREIHEQSIVISMLYLSLPPAICKYEYVRVCVYYNYTFFKIKTKRQNGKESALKHLILKQIRRVMRYEM